MRRKARSAAAAVAFAGALHLAPSPPGPPRAAELPGLGTELGQFPEGPMKALADRACLNCHSADLVRQQRLTEKQWRAEVEKMVGWGAAVPESDREALVAYLLARFGPDNDGFRPVEARPAGR